jgi:multidrug efflux pump subunit AcrA (membrane-fusion protein)
MNHEFIRYFGRAMMISQKLNEDLSKLKISRHETPEEGKRGFPRQSLIAILAAFILGAGLSILYFKTGAQAQGNKVLESTVQPSKSEAPGLSGGDDELPVLTAAGYVIPSVKIELGSKIIGRVEYLAVERGDLVKQGQVIARLECSDLKAQLQQAEAELEVARKRYDDLVAGARGQEINQAKARQEQADANLRTARTNLERYKELYKQGVVSAQQVDAAQNDYDIRLAEYKTATESLSLVQLGPRSEAVEVARAEIERAQAQALFQKSQFNNAVILSPIAGVVTDKLVEAGEVVAPAAGGVPGIKAGIVIIASLSAMRVEIDVNEADIGKLQLHQPAAIVLDSVPGKSYKGSIINIYPEANRQKGTVKVELAVEDADNLFKPEMSAKVVIKKAARAASVRK